METHLPAKPRSSGNTHVTKQSSFALKMEVTIPARVSAISPLVDAVMTALRHQPTSKELEIETALREALANAIKHGCSGDPTKFVQCSVVFENDRSVLIVVRDPGPGFDATALPDPTEGDRIYKSHGRGIFLINRMMDEVHFERGGAEIHMRSRL